MVDPWSAILRCPYCRGRFRFCEAHRPAECNAEFGILRCACSAFPVVDGIPIVMRARVGIFAHTTGAMKVRGVAVAHVVRLIEAGRSLEALVECLAVPALPWLARRWLPSGVANGHAGLRAARWYGKQQLRRQVLARRQTLSAQGLLDFYYQPGRSFGRGIGEYFVFRFAQPRHLAALALLATVPGSEKPVLDVACGLGHLEHYLAERTDPVAAMGTDMNFFQLWIARHWIATKARFVCAMAQDGLPFASDAFSATLCSDAYHLIPKRPELPPEIERCAPGRPVFLTRVGNGAVMPNEGRELTVQGYLEEFGAVGVRSFSETDLVRAYLHRRNPFAQPARDSLELGEVKWLSFAWNVTPTLRDPLWDKDAWPHAVGQINVNPIYGSTRTKDGDLQLRFAFPSPWYAYENHDMLFYHPRLAAISRAQLQRLAAWRDDPTLAALVESFVLIGLPARFLA